MELKSCVVCESTQSSPLYPEFQIVECECGHIYYTCSMSEDELRELYQKHYFSGHEYADYVADKPAIQRNFKARLAHVQKHVPAGGRLLEIGSAYGFFLELAKDHYQICGYEICQDGVKHAREKLGLDVRCEDFLQAEIEEASFDAICMYDCIEHLPRPDLFVQKIARLLRPGGKVFITTGDISALVPKIRGKSWRMIHPPTHIHYFSKDSLARLLHRSGLIPESVSYPAVWRSVNQTLTSVLKTKTPIKAFPFFFPLNTYDICELRGGRASATAP